jgi:hypothetical protein
MKRLIPGIFTFLAAADLFAQSSRRSPSAEDVTGAVAGAGIGLTCCVLYFLLIAVSIGAYIFTAIWIMKDAKARNSENAQLVTILGWIPATWVVGLIVHLVTRPKGNLVPCPHCGKRRLEGLATCPHCGQA